MPTPFMHMALAQRLIHDLAQPQAVRDFLTATSSQWGAFLFGSIAPDARVSSGLNRGDTHFFEYTPVVDPSAVDNMLRTHSELRRTAISDQDRAAFVAGYAAHLAMDQVWCTELLFPYFIDKEWPAPSRKTSFLMIHMLLGYMDRRDRAKIPPEDYPPLAATQPMGWLPFIGDTDLCAWRDIIASQLAPGAESRTLEILGSRIGLTTEQMRAHIDDTSEMDRSLWANVPPAQLAKIEETLYDATCATLVDYLNE